MDYFTETFTMTLGTPSLLADVAYVDRLVTVSSVTNTTPYNLMGFTTSTLVGVLEFRPFVLPAGAQLWASGQTGNTIQALVTKLGASS